MHDFRLLLLLLLILKQVQARTYVQGRPARYRQDFLTLHQDRIRKARFTIYICAMCKQVIYNCRITLNDRTDAKKKEVTGLYFLWMEYFVGGGEGIAHPKQGKGEGGSPVVIKVMNVGSRVNKSCKDCLVALPCCQLESRPAISICSNVHLCPTDQKLHHQPHISFPRRCMYQAGKLGI